MVGELNRVCLVGELNRVCGRRAKQGVSGSCFVSSVFVSVLIRYVWCMFIWIGVMGFMPRVSMICFPAQIV